MSKHRVVALKIIAGQLTVTEAAEQYGLSRRQVQRLLARYRADGIEAVDPRSRRPKSNPRSTPIEVVERVLKLRGDLIGRDWMRDRSRSDGTLSEKACRPRRQRRFTAS